MAPSVLHLSDVERETGEGVDREELIEWYLEQKEADFNSVEEVDAERELIGKALTKLAKVSGPSLHFWASTHRARLRTTTSWSCGVKLARVWHRLERTRRLLQMTARFITLSVSGAVCRTRATHN